MINEINLIVYNRQPSTLEIEQLAWLKNEDLSKEEFESDAEEKADFSNFFLKKYSGINEDMVDEGAPEVKITITPETTLCGLISQMNNILSDSRFIANSPTLNHTDNGVTIHTKPCYRDRPEIIIENNNGKQIIFQAKYFSKKYQFGKILNKPLEELKDDEAYTSTVFELLELK